MKKIIIEMPTMLYHTLKLDGVLGYPRLTEIIRNGTPLEAQSNRCDSCTHSEEQDGSNCYECVKGMADNFEEQPTSDDEIIKALKAVRTFHNGNYAPQIDEAIRRLTMKKSAYVQVNLSDERIQKAVAEAVEKMKAEIEAQPCKDAISRAEALKHSHIEYDDDGEGHRVIYTEDIEELPPVTPQRLTGKWIYEMKVMNNPYTYKCSVCKEWQKDKSKYCPNCGSYNGGNDNGDE